MGRTAILSICQPGSSTRSFLLELSSSGYNAATRDTLGPR